MTIEWFVFGVVEPAVIVLLAWLAITERVQMLPQRRGLGRLPVLALPLPELVAGLAPVSAVEVIDHLVPVLDLLRIRHRRRIDAETCRSCPSAIWKTSALRLSAEACCALSTSDASCSRRRWSFLSLRRSGTSRRSRD